MLLATVAAASSVNGHEAARPQSFVESASERAIATARVHIAKTDPGPTQFRAVTTERGFHVWVDHAAGYRRIVSLSAELEVLSIGPRIPLHQMRYPRCCGVR
jgi:hypothetical protein